MKRKNILILSALVLIVLVVLYFIRTPSLSEAEQQKRVEDYAFLLNALQEVGYEEVFSLKESKSLEENLRRLWLKESSFKDARKNVELLVILNNFDFINEGLQKSNSSKAVDFSHEEALWLILLLPDNHSLQAFPDLYDVLMERGTEAFRHLTDYNIWPYFEKKYSGYLEQMDPNFWQERVSEEMVRSFHNAEEDAQNRFVQAVDMKAMQGNSVRPRVVLSSAEAEELMLENSFEGNWNGGYIRVIEPEITGFGTEQPARTFASIYERLSDNVLAAVTHPADARFIIYEEYKDREYYSTYYSTDGRDDEFDLYLWHLHIRIIDLMTGEEIFSETKRGNPPPEEISITQILRGATITSDGEYNYDDFDYDRYAAVMVEYLNTMK